MPEKKRTFVRPLLVAVLLAWLVAPRPAGAYSVLTHEEVVDLVWAPQIVPLLKARFPGISDDAIRHAHAYAYGGSVIQDIGYYPFGSRYFSDLLHYVRTGDFVGALIRDSATPDEYAFALGALAHYSGDTIGHPYINRVTADEYPRLRRRYGQSITYEQDATAHLRTEFGFDVVGVANGFYSQQNYRDFIGFQVAKPLLERAFQETYGLPVAQVIPHEDLAIGSYRFSVSHLIPRMTKVALASYHDQIEHAHPGFERDKFLYRFQRTEFDKEFGVQYQRPGIPTRIFGAFIAILPKVGPLKALRLSVPNADEQTVYLRSVNDTVDRYKQYLAQVQAPITPLPAETAAVDPKLAAAAQQAPAAAPAAAPPTAIAKKNSKTDPVEQADQSVQKTIDQAVRQTGKQVRQTVEQAKTAAPTDSAPTIKLSHADAAATQAALGNTTGVPAQAQPTPPILADLDMDTGKPTAEGEYRLSDETHGRLLDEVTHAKIPTIPPGLRSHLLAYYAQDARTDDFLKKKPEEWKKVQGDLATLRSQPAPPLEASTPATSGVEGEQQ